MSAPQDLHDEVQTDLKTAEHSIATLSIHADDVVNTNPDVAPPLHVATTFRYPSNPDALVPEDLQVLNGTAEAHVYSRVTAPNTTRLETVLSSLLHGHALTYSSGLSAFHAILVYFRPNVIAISGGYHGCHGVIGLHKKLHNLRTVDLFNEKEWDEAGLGKGDIVHVETPVNPTGEARNLAYFAEKARKRGAIVTVDATFGPPGLQDPFEQGADVIMHSGTKYIGGHSDMLLGVLATKSQEIFNGLCYERVFLGSVPGNLEGWLGVRSLRTFELRVKRQSDNATRLVTWLNASLGDADSIVSKTVAKVLHASSQKDDMGWIKKQMPGGFGPVFAIYMKSSELAKRLPSKLRLFQHATSLGGVESLIEWRRMSDNTVGEELLRLSIGVEGFEDLRDDLTRAFEASAAELK